MEINLEQELNIFKSVINSPLKFDGRDLVRTELEYYDTPHGRYIKIPTVVDGESPYTKEEVLKLFARISEIYPMILEELIKLRGK